MRIEPRMGGAGSEAHQTVLAAASVSTRLAGQSRQSDSPPRRPDAAPSSGGTVAEISAEGRAAVKNYSSGQPRSARYLFEQGLNFAAEHAMDRKRLARAVKRMHAEDVGHANKEAALPAAQARPTAIAAARELRSARTAA